MSHIFISYSHKDKDYVHKLQKALQDEGFEVWIDDRIDFGTTWPMVIQRNLDTCGAFIVVMTENAYESKWVHNEVTRAERKNKPFFALLLSGDTWLGFEAVQYENVTGGKLPSKKFYGSIADAVNQEETRQKNPKLKPQRKLSKAAIASLIGLIAIIVVLLIGLPNIFSNTPVPTFSPSPTLTLTSPIPTKTDLPSVTPTPEPGYTIIDPQEVLNIAPSLRALGQLSDEIYSTEERNRINSTLPFTINSTPDVPILWRWFWCAANDKILEQNMTKINIVFDADGYLIPESQLAKIIFENSDPTYDGWKCFTYETVLRDWRPGTYKLTQTMNIASPINDGRDTFEAGYKIYEFTVNISP